MWFRDILFWQQGERLPLPTRKHPECNIEGELCIPRPLKRQSSKQPRIYLFRLEAEEPIKMQVKGEAYRSFSRQRMVSLSEEDLCDSCCKRGDSVIFLEVLPSKSFGIVQC
jgi:hypothetical protein